MKIKKKMVAVVVAVSLVTGCLVGGTLAWLTDKTDTIRNTFTVGNINITLTESDSGQDTDNDESTNSYKIVPGQTITKDPKVTVTAESESCWLFVKVEKDNNFDKFMEYSIADGWTGVTGETGVYYREVTSTASNQEFAVISNNVISVKSGITKSDMDALTSETLPKLSFTAYAVQKAGFDTVAKAWEEASK